MSYQIGRSHRHGMHKNSEFSVVLTRLTCPWSFCLIWTNVVRILRYRHQCGTRSRRRVHEAPTPYRHRSVPESHDMPRMPSSPNERRDLCIGRIFCCLLYQMETLDAKTSLMFIFAYTVALIVFVYITYGRSIESSNHMLTLHQPVRILAVFVISPMLFYKGIIYKDVVIQSCAVLLFTWDLYWLIR